MSAITAAITLALSAAYPIQAAEWPSSGYFDVVELDDGCVVTSEFEFDGRPDVRFLLSYRGDDEVRIAFTSYGWSATAGQTYEMSYLFRPTTSYTGPAAGFTSESIYHGFTTKFARSVLDDFASAESLEVVKDDVTVTHINLLGSSGATATLRRCVASVQRKAAEKARRESQWEYIAPDPFAPAPPETATPAAAVKGDALPQDPS